MSRPDRIAARITARHSSGSLPPVGAIPISSALARGRNPSASLSESDDRDVVAAGVPQPLADVAAGLRGVDDRDDLVRAEADHAHGGLAVVEAEVALGEDHEAAVGCGGIDPSLSAKDGREPRRATSSATAAATGERPRRTGAWRWVRLVPHTGFEPVVSALRGRCPGPLDECGAEPDAMRPTGAEDSRDAAGARNRRRQSGLSR